MKIKEIISNKLTTVIDVRNPGELLLGSFPGSINIPVTEMHNGGGYYDMLTLIN